MNSNVLSENLRHLMNTHGNLTEAELAQQTGIAQPTLNHILKNKTRKPRRDCLTKLASFFNISITQLVGDELPITNNHVYSSHYVPLIEWSQISGFLKDNAELDSNQSILCDTEIGQNAFSLKMKDSSMAPLFPENTLLIFDPEEKPYDRGYGLFFLEKQGIVFRQVILDGSVILLKAISPELQGIVTKLEEGDTFIALLLQTRMDFSSK